MPDDTNSNQFKTFPGLGNNQVLDNNRDNSTQVPVSDFAQTLKDIQDKRVVSQPSEDSNQTVSFEKVSQNLSKPETSPISNQLQENNFPQANQIEYHTDPVVINQKPVAPAPPPPPSFSSNSTSFSGKSSVLNSNDSIEPAMAENLSEKKSNLGKIITGVIILLIISAGVLLVSNLLKSRNSTASDSNSSTDTTTDIASTKNDTASPKVNLVYWGLWEEDSVIQDLIDEYQTQNPNVTIDYVKEDKLDYRMRLQNSLTQNQTPDIFRYHNSWLPMLKDNLQPDTKNNIAVANYFPEVSKDLAINGELFGVPLGYDTLVLFYNLDMLEKAGLSRPPKDWSEVQQYAQKLTIKDPQKNTIQVGGIALGTTNNVDNFSDILGLILLQNGANPASPDNDKGNDSLTYYTGYSKKGIFPKFDPVWNENMPNSTYAFATGKVAMIIAPTWRALEIEEINPDLKFKTAVVPQLSTSEKISWASYWVEGVSRNSPNADEAWKFLAFLSKDDNLQKIYQNRSQLRKFGEVYPKKSLAISQEIHDIIGSVAKQANYAQTWYLCSRTYDSGLNDETIKYYEDAINSMLEGDDIESVMPTLTKGIDQVMQKYGIVNTTNSSQ